MTSEWKRNVDKERNEYKQGQQKKDEWIRGSLQVSQLKSDDNWVQDALDDSCEAFRLTWEEVRGTKMLRWKDFNAFADAYYGYIKLEKKEGSLDYTLEEFCKKRYWISIPKMKLYLHTHFTPIQLFYVCKLLILKTLFFVRNIFVTP